MDWRPLRRKARHIEETHNRLSLALGRVPREPELAKELGIELHDFQLLLGELSGLEIGSLRIESPRDGKEEDLCEFLPADPEETPYHDCLRTEIKELLTRVIGELPGKERRILALYYFY
jgi:RNA polymerase sigma factor FliA